MFCAVYGTAEFDSEKYLLGALEENINNNIKSYILVPEQISVYTERKIIGTLGVSAQKNAEVLTFSRLSNRVMGERGPLRMNYIDGACKEILAVKALRQIEKNLDYFRPNVHQPGFSKLMAGLVSEFKRYGHTPDSLLAAAKEIEGKEGGEELPRKLKDLALFYEEFDKLINQSGSDAEDNSSIILPKIKDCAFPKNAHMFVMNFRSFTPLERDILTELLKKTAEFRLILCCDNPERPSDLFKNTGEAYQSLKKAAKDSGIPVGEPIPIKIKRDLSPDIEHIIKNYFLPRPQKYQRTPGHIHFVRPDNTFEEMVTAAETIHRLCREKGYRQKDFLILARNPEEYTRMMPHIFEKWGINVFLDNRRSLTQNPFLLYLSSVLDILVSGFSYERVMGMVKSGFCPDLTAEERDIFENYLLAACPGKSVWNSEDDWTYNPNETEYDMEVINRVKTKMLHPVIDIKKSITGRKTAGEIAEALFRFMEEQNNAETMQNKCMEFSQNGMVYLSEEYRRAWNCVVSVLAEIRDVMGDTPITYEKFQDLFISAAKVIKIGVSPQTVDGTMLSRIDMFRSSDVKIAIVLGMTDGVFPKSHSTEGLISDGERLLLRQVGLPLAMTASERSIDENMLIYNVLSAASDEIFFFSPLSSGSEPLSPSPIVTKLKKYILNTKDEPPRRKVPETKDEALSLLKSKLAANERDRDLKTLNKIFENDKSLEKFQIRLKNAERGYDILSKESVDKLYGRELLLSASRLERFNECAFKYFMRYGLVALPRDVAQFDPLSMGNILHGTLEKYFSKKRDFGAVTKEECQKEINEIVNTLASDTKDIMYKSSAYYKYLISRMSGIASVTAWETIKFFKESEFRPIGFEVKIGSGGDVPPIKLRTKKGKITVEGFIDRVDGAIIDDKKYISIVDYKSSETNLLKPLAEAGVKFQPLVYARAICKSGEFEPAAMFYQQMNDPVVDGSENISSSDYDKKVHGKVAPKGWIIDDPKAMEAFDRAHTFLGPRSCISPNEMKTRIENSERKIAETADKIFDGEISVNPYTEYKYDPCMFCDYSGICRQEQIREE